jgi:hypothetical protein
MFNLLMSDNSVVYALHDRSIKLTLYSMPERVAETKAAAGILFDVVLSEFALQEYADYRGRMLKALDILRPDEARGDNILKVAGGIPIYAI